VKGELPLSCYRDRALSSYFPAQNSVFGVSISYKRS
jgi:hypothetical protein